MKTLFGFLLSAALLTSTGCFLTAPPALTATHPVENAVAVKTYPPVTVDQVTPQNGRQVAQALMDEMDREAQANSLATPR